MIISIQDQYECDKASQLHYEFLLNRCSPKHFLPVLSGWVSVLDKVWQISFSSNQISLNLVISNSCLFYYFLVFKPEKDSKELGTHIFPAPKQADSKKSCWITFLGAHGHCEKHKDKYSLYNTPDLEDMNAHSSKKACLSRQDWWQVSFGIFCLFMHYH